MDYNYVDILLVQEIQLYKVDLDRSTTIMITAVISSTYIYTVVTVSILGRLALVVRSYST